MEKRIGNISDLYKKINGISPIKENSSFGEVFENTMKKFHIKNLQELNEDDKKDFYNQIHAGLTGNKIENDANAQKSVDTSKSFASKTGLDNLKKVYAQYSIIDDKSLEKLSPEELAAYVGYLRGIHGDMGKFIVADEFIKKMNEAPLQVKESEQDTFKTNNKPSDITGASEDINAKQTATDTIEFKKKTALDSVIKKFGKYTENDNETISKMSPEQLDSYVNFMQDAGDDSSKHLLPKDYLDKLNAGQITMPSAIKESYQEYSYFYERVFSKLSDPKEISLTEGLMINLLKDDISKKALKYYSSKRITEVSNK